MRQDLYKELYDLEKDYWWHVGKRQITFDLINRYSTSFEKALDIGCGAGLVVDELSKKYNQAYGVDMSADALNFCKQRSLQNLILAPAENIPLPEGSFDLITAFDLLEHADDAAVLRETRRLLKAGGIAVITVPSYPRLWSYWDEMLGHKRRYTIKSLRTVLETAGFKVEKISYSNFFILVPVLIVRELKKLTNKTKAQSDFIKTPKVLNNFLKKIYCLESRLIESPGLPAGLSVVAVARRI